MENTNLEELKGKNWVATMMLCWCLGVFGGHRFYTGKTTSAWVMVALTIVLPFVTPIWALVDGITIALGKFQHEDGSELYEKIDWLGYTYTGLMILSILGILGYLLLIFVFAAAAISGS